MAVKVTGGANHSNNGVLKARVHCVDIATKQVQFAWLFEINVDKPLIQRSYQIQTYVGKHMPYKFQYVNPLSEFVTLEFVSSNSAIMEVREEKLAFETHESKNIELFVPPKSKAGSTEEVILYINDESRRVSESLLFKINVKE